MKTLIINGSPKGNTNQCGSYFLAKAFVSKMKEPCEIIALARIPLVEVYGMMKDYESIIIITPNYIHSFPSGVVEFLNKLPKAQDGQALSLIVQSGYPESRESEIACRYFRKVCNKQAYRCLETVIKGEGAGIGIMPQMFDKLKERFAEFGVLYEQTGSFDEQIVKEFAEPYTLKKSTERMLNLMGPISNAMGWHKFLRKNNAIKQRKDMPFLDHVSVSK